MGRLGKTVCEVIWIETVEQTPGPCVPGGIPPGRLPLGYVAIWRDEDPQPWLITDMPVSALPPADQKALKEGISLPEDYPLTKALEDYCS